MQKSTVEVSREGAVVTVALDRPNQHNALNSQLIADLTSTICEIQDQRNVRSIVITGKGRSFCAGADLSSFDEERELFSVDKSRVEADSIFELMETVNTCPMPVVARVNGAAIGGGMGLVSCCDIVVAVEKAIFGFSEVRLGLVPAVISPYVVAKIGSSKARELFLTGERFSANDALAMGLVHKVAAEDELDHAIQEINELLIRGAPGAHSDIKQLIRDLSSGEIADKRKYVIDLFVKRIQSEEGLEGIRAFLEKRRPEWP